jgi:formyl-CoA transferase
LPEFASLAQERYQKNAGRIADVKNLNKELTRILQKFKTNEIVAIFNQIGIPISEINPVPQVAKDPLVAKNLLKAKDPRTGLTITLAPPPNMTDFLSSQNQELTFPPRFGEHNREIYGRILGYGEDQINHLKSKGII